MHAELTVQLTSIQAAAWLQLQIKFSDAKAYFYIPAILLNMYYFIHPEAFNHFINPALIALVPWTWNANQTERIWKCYLFTKADESSKGKYVIW